MLFNSVTVRQNQKYTTYKQLLNKLIKQINNAAFQLLKTQDELNLFQQMGSSMARQNIRWKLVQRVPYVHKTAQS